MARAATWKLIELADEGLISWEAIARACLNVMSEADVQDMAEAEGFIETEEDPPEDPSEEDDD